MLSLLFFTKMITINDSYNTKLISDLNLVFNCLSNFEKYDKIFRHSLIEMNNTTKQILANETKFLLIYNRNTLYSIINP